MPTTMEVFHSTYSVADGRNNRLQIAVMAVLAVLDCFGLFWTVTKLIILYDEPTKNKILITRKYFPTEYLQHYRCC